MKNTMNWIAGMATVAALALAAEAVNDIVRQPTDYGAVLAEQDRAIIELRGNLAVLKTAVELQMEEMDLEVQALRKRQAFEQEKARVQDLRSSGASLFKSASSQDELAELEEASAAPVTLTAQARAEVDRRVLIEQLLIKAGVTVFQERKKIQHLEALLADHGIEYDRASAYDAAATNKIEEVSLHAIEKAHKEALARHAASATLWEQMRELETIETAKRAFAQQELAIVEAEIDRLKRTALKLEAVLRENGIDPELGGLADE